MEQMAITVAGAETADRAQKHTGYDHGIGQAAPFLCPTSVLANVGILGAKPPLIHQVGRKR